MSLISCKDCGKAYSTDAKTCPNCGARRPFRMRWWGWAFVAFILIGMISSALNPDGNRGGGTAVPTDPNKRVFLAAKVCLLAIQRSLNDPDSAKYDPLETWGYGVNPDGTIGIYPALRAKNAFGGYVYKAWQCTGRFEGEQFVINPTSFHDISAPRTDLRTLGQLR